MSSEHSYDTSVALAAKSITADVLSVSPPLGGLAVLAGLVRRAGQDRRDQAGDLPVVDGRRLVDVALDVDGAHLERVRADLVVLELVLVGVEPGHHHLRVVGAREPRARVDPALERHVRLVRRELEDRVEQRRRERRREVDRRVRRDARRQRRVGPAVALRRRVDGLVLVERAHLEGVPAGREAAVLLRVLAVLPVELVGAVEAALELELLEQRVLSSPVNVKLALRLLLGSLGRSSSSSPAGPAARSRRRCRRCRSTAAARRCRPRCCRRRRCCRARRTCPSRRSCGRCS